MFSLPTRFMIGALWMSTILTLVIEATKPTYMMNGNDDRRSDNSYLNTDSDYNSYSNDGYGSNYQRNRDHRLGSTSDYGRNFGSSRSPGYSMGGYGTNNRDYQSGSQYSTMGSGKYGSYSSRYSRNIRE